MYSILCAYIVDSLHYLCYVYIYIYSGVVCTMYIVHCTMYIDSGVGILYNRGSLICIYTLYIDGSHRYCRWIPLHYLCR